MFRHDSTNIKPTDPAYQLLPKGKYIFSIVDATEKTSKKGDPMIELLMQVIENPDYHGKTMKHWVVFMAADKPGAYMSVHFRKCIGVPYEGDVEIDSSNWTGKKVLCELDTKTTTVDGKTYVNNNIKSVMPYDGVNFPEVGKDGDIPF